MTDSHTCTCPRDFGEGNPLTLEDFREALNLTYATLWIEMLSSPQMWGALRRFPPKAYLLEMVDRFLRYANQEWPHLSEDELRSMRERRNAPIKRLHDLLVAWEPPVMTDEIREAARALYMSEFSRLPDEEWNLEGEDAPPCIEACLVWPEGEWNEEAFLAQQAHEKPSP